MLFNSLSFLVFFPVIAGLHFLLPQRFRWLLLLLSSLFFYAVFIPAYIFILLAVILVDYYAGIYIERSPERRKRYFILALIFNFGILAFFKYYNFGADNLNELAEFLHWNYSLPLLSLVLPLGLSFYLFQATSYLIEVYHGRQLAERKLGIFALYVTFFPQLVAGPIERPQHLLPQLREEKFFDSARVSSGLQLMFWGFFKKIAVADRLAELVDGAYANSSQGFGAFLFIATVLFAFQIYCDFSGYVDIARGAARVLGFRLTENFNQPYGAKSIREFWRRWHITLYHWFKDYVYIPLGGNRKGRTRTILNILIVFALTGLWHGAEWTFVVWGLLHGAYLVFEFITRGIRERLTGYFSGPLFRPLWNFAQWAATFLMVCLAWVFFRADSLPRAWFILTRIAADAARLVDPGLYQYIFSFFRYYFISLAVVLIGEFFCRNPRARSVFDRFPAWFSYPLSYALIIWFFWFGYFGERVFIYFQF